MEKTNAARFISAFNQVDYALRTQHDVKRSMSFSEMVRRCSAKSGVLKRFEEELIDYSRLRNSIVHNSNDEVAIAEPHDDVTNRIERIARLLSTPPPALTSVCKRDVLTVDAKVKIVNVIKLMHTSGYSNLPVCKNGEIVGVANNRELMGEIGRVLTQEKDLKAFLETEDVGNVVANNPERAYFAVANRFLTIETALNMFSQNRKLLVILITKSGEKTDPPIGILTVTDIIDMNKVIETY